VKLDDCDEQWTAIKGSHSKCDTVGFGETWRVRAWMGEIQFQPPIFPQLLSRGQTSFNSYLLWSALHPPLPLLRWPSLSRPSNRCVWESEEMRRLGSLANRLAFSRRLQGTFRSRSCGRVTSALPIIYQVSRGTAMKHPDGSL